MKEIYFTSDTHFGHENIIKYSKRPYKDVGEMNEIMIQNWNAQVKHEDEVWHLGDFAFMGLSDFKSLLLRLNGRIHVILGNHDKVITSNKKTLLDQGRIRSIQNYTELSESGHKFILLHYGMRVWNGSHKGTIHLYGHSHGSLPPHGKSVDVGVDCKEITSEYRPIHIDEVITYMNKRQGETVDHHIVKP